jgi:hypothetical protein
MLVFFKLIQSILLIAAFLSIQSLVLAEIDVKIPIYNKSELQKTSDNLDAVRMSFLDLSKRQKIGIREINLEGETTNFIQIPSEYLDYDIKNFRWGATLQHNSKKDTFLLGLWKSGIVEFSRSGEVLSEFPLNNISHSIEITSEGNLLFPYSWSQEDESQITEINTDGDVVWEWSAKNFINKHNFKMSVSSREPKSFVAITGAIELDLDTIVATLSQANVIVFINKKDGSVEKFITFSQNEWGSNNGKRPHTPVVLNKELIGYSLRAPNSVKLWDFDCECYKLLEVKDKNAIRKDGKNRTRSLSLQYLGGGQWFVSGSTMLRQIKTDGTEIWKAKISPKPLWSGFHKVIRYELK